MSKLQLLYEKKQQTRQHEIITRWYNKQLLNDTHLMNLPDKVINSAQWFLIKIMKEYPGSCTKTKRAAAVYLAIRAQKYFTINKYDIFNFYNIQSNKTGESSSRNVHKIVTSFDIKPLDQRNLLLQYKILWNLSTKEFSLAIERFNNRMFDNYTKSNTRFGFCVMSISDRSAREIFQNDPTTYNSLACTGGFKRFYNLRKEKLEDKKK